MSFPDQHLRQHRPKAAHALLIIPLHSEFCQWCLKVVDAYKQSPWTRGTALRPTISGMDFSVDLHSTVLWNEFIRNWDTLMNCNALSNNGIVFHAADILAAENGGNLNLVQVHLGSKRSYFDILSMRSILVMPSQ
jgi:hypothetical protein